MNQFTTTIGTPGSVDRDELRRQRRDRVAATSGWEELELPDLTFTRFAIVHEPSGEQYKVCRGEVDVGPTHPASAYFHAKDGGIVFLERLPRR